MIILFYRMGVEVAVCLRAMPSACVITRAKRMHLRYVHAIHDVRCKYNGTEQKNGQICRAGSLMGKSDHGIPPCCAAGPQFLANSKSKSLWAIRRRSSALRYCNHVSSFLLRLRGIDSQHGLGQPVFEEERRQVMVTSTFRYPVAHQADLCHARLALLG